MKNSIFSGGRVSQPSFLDTPLRPQNSSHINAAGPLNHWLGRDKYRKAHWSSVSHADELIIQKLEHVTRSRNSMVGFHTRDPLTLYTSLLPPRMVTVLFSPSFVRIWQAFMWTRTCHCGHVQRTVSRCFRALRRLRQIADLY